MDFKNINFKWTFRDYQQRVLDNSARYLADKKINIVAAPGSGKTILGLELIRRLNNPCLIFSPTTIIRDQWGDRFEEAFLAEDLDVDDYVSFDLRNVKLITSVTYQALYSAMERIDVTSDDEVTDYSDVDIFKIIQKCGIKTICLDEAHHLQNEWQKSLEKFVKAIGNDVTVISLTATPPYDASKQEWNRYVSTCGNIDDEIFVPELVKEKTLCPHQDYIYFNYPTTEELEKIKDYRLRVFDFLEYAKNLECFERAMQMINIYILDENEFFFENTHEILCLLSVLKHYEYKYNERGLKRVIGKFDVPKFDVSIAQVAFQFMISNEDFLNKTERESLKKELVKYDLIESGEICFDLNDDLKKTLISSVGKLDSINKIVKSEKDALGNKLKMLILTDYIRRESMVDIGTENSLKKVSVVSIFESIRREKFKLKMGCLSGNLIILPDEVETYILEKYHISKDKLKVTKLLNTFYSVFDFKLSNKMKILIVGDLFENGYISILIGTKSLLGEGWDSPCINSLIIASFVGSFMLSNQMRGRAIRVYKKDANKVSNIWHLVTIEPNMLVETDKGANQLTGTGYNSIVSNDYKKLTKRFNCFVAPNYSSDIIESGIKRISIICKPFNAEKFKEINQKMEEISKDRYGLSQTWQRILNLDKINLVLKTTVPKSLKIPFIFGFKRSIKKIGKCILKTFMKLKKVSKRAKLKCEKSADKQSLSIFLLNATVFEQNLFSNAIDEFLDKIDDPRYLIVKLKFKKYYNCKISFACPSMIGENKNSVSIFEKYLKKYLGDYVLVYTKNPKGKRLLSKCIKQSFLMKVDDDVETSQALAK